MLYDFRPKTVLEIGGGFGTLAEILEQSNLLKFKYINLDLPPMFLISEAYMEACSPKTKIFLTISKILMVVLTYGIYLNLLF